MKYLQYLREDAIKSALNIKEPETGEKYPSEEVKRYLKMIDAAMKQASKLEQNDANDAIVADLRDKKKKWSNVDSETKPVKIKQEEPPPEDQEGDGGEPPPEDVGEEPPPEKEEENPEDDKKKKKGKVPPQFQKKESKGLKGILLDENTFINKKDGLKSTVTKMSKGYSVKLHDIDADETLEVSKIFPKEKDAIEYAKKIIK